MEATLFRQYLEIAKEMGVTSFRISGDSMSADLLQVVQPINLEEITRDMPSDEKLLGLEEPSETLNLGDK